MKLRLTNLHLSLEKEESELLRLAAGRIRVPFKEYLYRGNKQPEGEFLPKIISKLSVRGD